MNLNNNYDFTLFVDTEFVAMKDGIFLQREEDDSPPYTAEHLPGLYIVRNKKRFIPGTKLKDNEWLLKVEPDTYHDYQSGGKALKCVTGFLAKPIAKNQIPISMDGWGNIRDPKAKYWETIKAPTYVHVEDYSEGWRVYGYRAGKSQNWVKVVHPEGFVLEIYLRDFIILAQMSDIVGGVIQGKFKWEKHKLIKQWSI